VNELRLTVLNNYTSQISSSPYTAVNAWMLLTSGWDMTLWAKKYFRWYV